MIPRLGISGNPSKNHPTVEDRAPGTVYSGLVRILSEEKLFGKIGYLARQLKYPEGPKCLGGGAHMKNIRGLTDESGCRWG